MVSQVESLVAVHENVAAHASTAMLPLPLPQPTRADAGVILNVHGAAACCATVKAWPAAVIVPLRAAPVFRATVNATLPLPAAPAGWLSVIQSAFDAAVHAHDEAEAVTANDPGPPLSLIAWPDGAIVNTQDAGAAACVIVSVWPAIVAVPVRAAPVFGATVTATLPLPVPAARSSVIHDWLDAAVHAQVAADAVTVTEPAAPVSGTL